MLLPVYQFHAQRFNANAVLLATWPLATYCFLRSFETPRDPAGPSPPALPAALAMLGKYYSVFLIVSFAVRRDLCIRSGAPISPRSRPGFRSPPASPRWCRICYWLATTGAQPFAYALERHAGKAFVPSLIEAALFVLGLAMMLAVPAAVWALDGGRSSQDDPRRIFGR